MDKEPVVAEGTKQKIIKVFDNSFIITSTPLLTTQKAQLGWTVVISFKRSSEVTEIESYTEYIKDRIVAEEACLGYFLIKHCRGGIYWGTPPEGEK